MTTTLRAAIYARFSSDLQSDRSIDDQVAICRAYAISKGYAVTEVFSDEAMSSMDWGRPGLHAMLQAAEAGRFEVLVAEMPDRISRDPEHLIAIFKRMDHYRVRIDSPQDGVATQLSILLRSLTGAVFYGDLSARVSNRMREQAKQGRILGRPAYGYRNIPGRPGEKEIDPAEAEVVRRIFADFLAGESPGSIAEALNREGVPSPGRTPWQLQNICHGSKAQGARGILSNPIYVGRARFGGQRRSRHPVSGKIVVRRSPEGEVAVPVPHLRIIDDETWERAQALRRRRAERRGASPSGTPEALRRETPAQARTLLSGLVMCGACGSPMIRCGGGNSAYGSRLICSSAHAHKGCDNRRTYTVWRLEKEIIDRMVEALSDESRMRAAIAAYNRKRAEMIRRTQGEETVIRRRLAEIDGALMRLVEMIAGSGRSAEIARDKIEALDAERAGLEERLRLAEAESKVTTLRAGAVARYRRALETLRQDLSAGRRPATLMAFRNLIDSVVLYPTPRYRPMEFSLNGRIGPFLGMDTAPEGRSADAIVSDRQYEGFPNDHGSDTVVALGRFVTAA